MALSNLRDVRVWSCGGCGFGVAECAAPSPSLHSLRPDGGFNRSSKLKVRAARGCATPDTDGLRIPSRVSSVRAGATPPAPPAHTGSRSVAAAKGQPVQLGRSALPLSALTTTWRELLRHRTLACPASQAFWDDRQHPEPGGRMFGWRRRCPSRMDGASTTHVPELEARRPRGAGAAGQRSACGTAAYFCRPARTASPIHIGMPDFSYTPETFHQTIYWRTNSVSLTVGHKQS